MLSLNIDGAVEGVGGRVGSSVVVVVSMMVVEVVSSVVDVVSSLVVCSTVVS